MTMMEDVPMDASILPGQQKQQVPIWNAQKAIVHKSFNHGWFYHYNIHGKKAHDLCAARPVLSGLGEYLYDVFEHCPQEPFVTGPRSSKVRSTIPVTLARIEGHEVSALAREGLVQGRFRTAHMNVQMWMLQHDAKTVSIETPLWLEQGEDAAVQDFLGVEGPLSGHIDALRIEDDKVWIWDYKPKAAKEKYAALQTYLYALMLSWRAKIPLEQMRCGYFDEEVAFVFEPVRSFLDRPVPLSAAPAPSPAPAGSAVGSLR